MRQRLSGFSLVELSIVLVILGLLAGGVLSGQSLIHAAELRKVSTDISKFRTSFYSFRDKYFALPGDMSNATAFWGKADADLTTCLTTTATTRTCDGDGNGQISWGPESYRLWQHLVNAGLMEGTYSGVPGPNPPAINPLIDDIIGTNLPQAPLRAQNGYIITFSWNRYGYSLPAQNTLTIGGQKNSLNGTIEGRALKPEDTWNIDTKLDDGKPDQGMVQIYALYPNCITVTTPPVYNLTMTSVECQMLVSMGM